MATKGRKNRIRSSVKNIGAFFPLLLECCHPKTYHSADIHKIKGGGDSSEAEIGSMDQLGKLGSQLKSE